GAFVTLEFEPTRGFGVYVHWPWCAKICPYCDFNVYAAKSHDPEPMIDGIIADIAGWRSRIGPRRIDSVFFGGGTPSLAPPKGVERVLNALEQAWGLASDAEISLEANPDDWKGFADFVAAGVNRLSLGVQSMSDASLEFLGRNHNAATARRAIDGAKRSDAALSLDFIYALPGQAAEDWARELTEALRFGADHLSLYELTIAEGTAFHNAVARGNWSPMEENGAADLYEITQDLTVAAGMPAYEISNHARDPTFRARHNLIYWRSGDWLGLGPGAHGRLTHDGWRMATEAARRPQTYIDQVSRTGVGSEYEDPLSLLQTAEERLIMGLRIADGVHDR
ncbi:MAG: radical SAM family heme chaperone HemW, partial [Pseudomonadota bacterium]